MSTLVLIKENQREVRGLTDVTATLRHKKDRKGGFGLWSCILGFIVAVKAAQCCSGGGGALL